MLISKVAKLIEVPYHLWSKERESKLSFCQNIVGFQRRVEVWHGSYSGLISSVKSNNEFRDEPIFVQQEGCKEPDARDI